MKNGFKDPIKSRVPTTTKESPFDFRAPPYDERSSIYVNAGSHYGEGFRQPVGTKGNPKQNADTLPFGRVKTMQTYYLPEKNLDVDIVK